MCTDMFVKDETRQVKGAIIGILILLHAGEGNSNSTPEVMVLKKEE